MEIRALRPNDDRSAFQSGDEALDRFFHRYAGQNQFRHYLGVTYVAVDGDPVLGFATVAPRHLEIEDLAQFDLLEGQSGARPLPTPMWPPIQAIKRAKEIGH